MSCPDGWLSHFFAACVCVRESCRRDIARIEREIADSMGPPRDEKADLTKGARHVVIRGKCYGAHFNQHEYWCCLASNCKNNVQPRECRE